MSDKEEETAEIEGQLSVICAFKLEFPGRTRARQKALLRIRPQNKLIEMAV